MPARAIRLLAPDDYDAWYRLWRGYQAFYESDIPEATSRVTWHRLLDRAEPMHGAFALEGGRPVGLVHYLEHRSSWTEGDYCYLQDLFVVPEARGGGVGRMLIEHVHGEARRRGCSRVYWLTQEDNTTARRLYDRIAERSGFIQYRIGL
jgi:GNAT superfamily N-acetyltransferase